MLGLAKLRKFHFHIQTKLEMVKAQHNILHILMFAGDPLSVMLVIIGLWVF